MAAELAGDLSALDQAAHGGRGLKAGGPAVSTGLVRLRRVDAPEAPAGAVEVDRIAVYYPLRRRWSRRQQGDHRQRRAPSPKFHLLSLRPWVED